MRRLAQRLCRWRARNSTRIVLMLSSCGLRCDTTGPVRYSASGVCEERYTFTHDSFLPSIILERSAAALGPYDGGAREDTL